MSDMPDTMLGTIRPFALTYYAHGCPPSFQVDLDMVEKTKGGGGVGPHGNGG